MKFGKVFGFYWLGTDIVKVTGVKMYVCLLGGTQRLWGEEDYATTVVGHWRL